MNKPHALITATLLACVALTGNALAAADGAPLAPADIKATFGTGNAFTSTDAGSGGKYTIVLKPDGHATRAVQGKTNVTPGTWRINDTGYCSKWGKAAEHCYTVQKTASAYDVL